jgi:cytochrome b subunit of formate dehydrogenase/nitrate/TMAO reductase-like tetraheme cytochrome c subunit
VRPAGAVRRPGALGFGTGGKAGMVAREFWTLRLTASLLAIVCLCAPARAEDDAASVASSAPVAVTGDTPNSTCLDCHGVKGFAVPKGETGGAPKRHISLDAHAFAESAHGKLNCVACHADISSIPHKMNISHAVDCVSCHKETALSAKEEDDKAKIGNVMHQIEQYLGSIHARPNKDDPTKPNATCADCHSAHYVFPTRSEAGKDFRQSTPQICGRCHEKEASLWANSVHAGAIRQGKDGATCADCHTAHAIDRPKQDPIKLLITRNCGSCHAEQYATYRGTYHGQVNALGYAHTAKCADCHEPHDTMKPDSPGAKMSAEKRLQTCQTCHKEAPANFRGFYPHGNSHDFARYPEMWIASKFMIALLAGVFTFFWSHSALWFYREWRDRKDGVHHILVDNAGNAVSIPTPPNEAEGKYFRRWSAPWRLAHLVLAIAVMVLVLTGTSVLYADSFWAPYVMKALGGTKIAAIIHRCCALIFIVIFFGHIGVAAVKVFKTRKTFRWFGPYSLLPNLGDFRDCWAMFKWFFGKGPRPTFDHWTYWEKFDYWAPFWGMFIIGLSGLTLWSPTVAARILPGWIFNVSTIVHGEEAFLAAVFLFTVHYFNCHFRPTKLPQDICMFTGCVPLNNFIEEHGVEYRRLLESGELKKCLVDPPSTGLTRRASALGFTLIAVGLTLLTLVLLGFWQKVLFG